MNFKFSSAKLSQMLGSVENGWLEVRDKLAGGAKRLFHLIFGFA
jgi:hypothetical protein